MACALAGSVPVSAVPQSALSTPLSVHGVVLFALPGSVVHVDAAEYVAWMSARIESLSHQLRRLQSPPTPASTVSIDPATVAPPPLAQSSSRDPWRRTLPPLVPAMRDIPPSSRGNERLSLQSVQSVDRPEDDPSQSTSFFAGRKQQILKRIFDRAVENSPVRSASVKVARRSISMDVLRRRPSSSANSAAASPTARSSPMSGVTAGSSPRREALPRSPSVLAYPKPTRWAGCDAAVVAPRNAPDTPLFADHPRAHARLRDLDADVTTRADREMRDVHEDGEDEEEEEDGNDSLRSMSARDLDLHNVVPTSRRSLSEAGRLPRARQSLAFLIRNQSAHVGPRRVDAPQSPVLKAEVRGGDAPRDGDAQGRFDALHCALRMSNPAYTIELPGGGDADGGDEHGGAGRRGSTAGRRSLSLGDERFHRDSSVGQLALSNEAREKRCELADAALARRASTVGFVPISGPGMPFGGEEDEEADEGRGGKVSQMNSRMRKSLRRVKRKDSMFRTSIAVDGDELARTVSTSAIPANFGRASTAGAKKAFRTYSRWKDPEDGQKDSRVRRFASMFRLRQAKAPYQPV